MGLSDLRNPWKHIQACLSELPEDLPVEMGCGCTCEGGTGMILRRCRQAKELVERPALPEEMWWHYAITVSPEHWLTLGKEYHHVRVGRVTAAFDGRLVGENPQVETATQCKTERLTGYLLITPAGVRYGIGDEGGLWPLEQRTPMAYGNAGTLRPWRADP